VAFAFGDHVLDLERRELRRSGDLVDLEPQVFDLLAYLVQQRDRVVSKDDLLQAVWGGRIVSEAAMTSRINAVRRAVGDSGAAQQVIRTIARKGLRFVAAVQEQPKETAERVATALQEMPLAFPDRPSIAVLPFVNLSADPQQEYFADGMVEELITALSRIRWLFVIARNSSFTYKGRPVDVKRVGRELGVRYVLEGSVRKAGERVRIAAQLIEAQTGAHLWAERFDGSLEDVFELQDEVARSVAGVIEPTLQAAEVRRSADRQTDDLTAYDLYLRALPYAASPEPDRIALAFELIQEAIDRDPNYARALVLAAHSITRWTSTARRTIGKRAAARRSFSHNALCGMPRMTLGSLPTPPLSSAITVRISMQRSPWLTARSRSTRATPAVGIGRVCCATGPGSPNTRSNIWRRICASARATVSPSI
jgi:TolB-like protein